MSVVEFTVRLDIGIHNLIVFGASKTDKIAKWSFKYQGCDW